MVQNVWKLLTIFSIFFTKNYIHFCRIFQIFLTIFPFFDTKFFHFWNKWYFFLCRWLHFDVVEILTIGWKIFHQLVITMGSIYQPHLGQTDIQFLTFFLIDFWTQSFNFANFRFWAEFLKSTIFNIKKSRTRVRSPGLKVEYTSPTQDFSRNSID